MFVGVTDNISESNMKEKIKAMTEIDKLKVGNMIISVNQLFEPEEDETITSQVPMIANKLLNDWLDENNDVLDIEYENYLKEKEKFQRKK